MNTIIKQRIIEAAKEYSDFNYNDEGVEVPDFIAGANYALQNQWISVDEALPEFKGNFSDSYFIRTETGFCAVTTYYRTSEKEYWWNFEKVKVTHWMPIPELKISKK